MSTKPSTRAVDPAPAGSGFEPGALAQQAVIFFSFALVLPILAFRKTLLPDRFSYDGNRIRDIALGIRPSYGDPGYQRVADLYRSTGLVGHDTTVGFLNFLCLIAVVVLVRKKLVQPSRAWTANLFLCLTLVFGAVYLGYYSKDTIALLVSVAVLVASPKKWGDVLAAAVICGYGLLFRPYWIMVAAMYLGLRVAFRNGSKRTLVLCAVLGIVALGLAIVLLQHHPADYYRTSVNASRINDPDARTMLKPLIISDGTVPSLLNVGYAVATLIVPIPLAVLGGPYYVILASVFVMVWGTFALHGRRLESVTENPRLARSIAFILAFACVQGLFEPDYGSALRHLVSVMPIMLYVVWSRDPSGRECRS